MKRLESKMSNCFVAIPTCRICLQTRTGMDSHGILERKNSKIIICNHKISINFSVTLTFKLKLNIAKIEILKSNLSSEEIVIIEQKDFKSFQNAQMCELSFFIYSRYY